MSKYKRGVAVRLRRDTNPHNPQETMLEANGSKFWQTAKAGDVGWVTDVTNTMVSIKTMKYNPDHPGWELRGIEVWWEVLEEADND